MASWVSISEDSPFSLSNIPFGIISTSDNSTPRPAIAIGDRVLDLSKFAQGGGFQHLPEIQSHQHVFSAPTLNAFAALGRATHRAVRRYLQAVLTASGPHAALLEHNAALQKDALLPLASVTPHLPLAIGDYTDFYAGLHHAFNVGVLFRGAQNALQPNYRHLPVGYHGRASSVVVSGTPIRRPNGQTLAAGGATAPRFGPCQKLDFELELGAFVCGGNELGAPVPVDEAAARVFGFVLLNDWSARDVQAWEYVPLGPFNAKNFGTTVSPWVVLADALEPFRAVSLDAGKRDQLLPYLREKEERNVFDIRLEVELRSESGSGKVITRTSAKNLLFSFPQMLAHHTSTGCNMNVGDLLGSGTISGTEPGSQGSLLEQTQNGKQPITIADGEERTFLQDGDEVMLWGVCGEKGAYVGFGECRGRILPAHSLLP